jgi:anti-sigma regulatory factor (Ser/Thr protein kinase)
MGLYVDDPADSEVMTLSLPRDPACAAQARDFVRAELGTQMTELALERALLTVSELVTNAWKHGEGAIELRYEPAEGYVRFEVVDEGTGAIPAIRRTAGDQTGGWGLRIVEELSLRWGCFEGTTHVWAEISLS